MEGIIERFNLYKYKQEGVAYQENGLEAKNISFLTYQKVPIEPEEDKSVTGSRKQRRKRSSHSRKRRGARHIRKKRKTKRKRPCLNPIR